MGRDVDSTSGSKQQNTDKTEPAELQNCSNWQFIGYFLWLGTFGFGGPIALAGYMQRDLVERNRWVSKEDYLHGLALSQLCPGPFAAQLAIYLGWVRDGILGATLVSIAFILPSFIMVLAISIFYSHFGGLSWIQGIFYGIGAAVIAIILRSVFKLTRMTIKKDIPLWIVFFINMIITILTSAENVWIFVLSGILIMLLKTREHIKFKPNSFFAIAWPVLFTTGIQGPANLNVLVKILLYFAWAGTFVFGSGLAIVPFLHGGVVEKYHWLTERQFIDAVAVAMITPGPVVITVAFIGYLVAGVAGAILAAMGVFVPCYLFVIVLAPHYRRYIENIFVKSFVSGVIAAAVGAIGGAVIILGRQAIIDLNTIGIFLVTFAILFTIKKMPEPLLMVIAGLAGVLLKSHVIL